MGRSLGVADSTADIDGGAINGCTVGVTTPAAGKFTTLTSTGTTTLGDAAADTIGFYGATPIAQRASSVQANSAVSVSSNITIAASLTAWIVEVTATLNALGIWKGAA
jgi:hypothetical protein